jgi:NAD-dependent DNA ligase
LVDNGTIPSTGNPRNTVAGIVNAKNPNKKILKLMRFVAYELIEPRYIAEKQMATMHQLGFQVVHYVVNDDISIDSLTENLELRKKQSQFEIDGIIVNDSSKDHGKNMSGNPDNAFAFKLPTSEVIVLVEKVIWNISKDNLLKPTVVFGNVSLGGVNIKKATGFNAKFIIDNGIGPGAEILVTRSGDVIPYIKKVVKKAQKPELPEGYDYEFTKSRIDIKIIDNGINENVSNLIKLKQLQNTIIKLNVDGLKEASISKMFDKGIVTLKQVFELTEASLKEFNVDSFGDKKISNIIEAITRMKSELGCLKIMSASNCFGKGSSEKTLSLILTSFPDFMQNKPEISDLIKIDGIGPETSNNFVQNIDNFKKYIKDNHLIKYCENNVKSSLKLVLHKLSGMKILFSGSKDVELLEMIKANGGELVTNISKMTDILIMKDPSEETVKQKFAKKNGIRIMNPEEFKNKY